MRIKQMATSTQECDTRGTNIEVPLYKTTVAQHLSEIMAGDPDLKCFDKLRYKLKCGNSESSHTASQLKYSEVRACLKVKIEKCYKQASSKISTWECKNQSKLSRLRPKSLYPTDIQIAARNMKICKTILNREWKMDIN